MGILFVLIEQIKPMSSCEARGSMGQLDRLTRCIDNMILGLEPEEVSIPQLIRFDQMLWKFKDSVEPKPFANCDKDELLEVVKSLTSHIQELEGEINVLKHAQQALALL
jgi:hypothetical protein